MHRTTWTSARARGIAGLVGVVGLGASGLGMVGMGAEPGAGFTVQVRERAGESDAAFARALHREAAGVHAGRVLRRVAQDPAARQSAGAWAAEFTDGAGNFAAERAAEDLARRVRAEVDADGGTIRVDVHGPAGPDAAWLAGAVQRALLEEDAAGERREAEARMVACRHRLEEIEREIEMVQTQRETIVVQNAFGTEIAASLGDELRRVGAKIDELTEAARGVGPPEREQLAAQLDVHRKRREELARRDIDLTRAALRIESLRSREEALMRSRDVLWAELARASSPAEPMGRLLLLDEAGPAR